MTHPLASLADLKRALTVGSRWQTRYSANLPNPKQPKDRVPTVSDWTTRQVVHVQTNAVAFAILDHPDAIAAGTANPHRSGSWLEFPKAKLCTFANGTIRINRDEHHWREY